MDSLTLRFDSTEQLQHVTGFVESVFIIHLMHSLDVMQVLNNKLNKLASMNSETQLSIDLSKNEVSCLKDMCDALSHIGTDSATAGLNVASMIA